MPRATSSAYYALLATIVGMALHQQLLPLVVQVTTQKSEMEIAHSVYLPTLALQMIPQLDKTAKLPEEFTTILVILNTAPYVQQAHIVLILALQQSHVMQVNFHYLELISALTAQSAFTVLILILRRE
jgi:hypothetical protein